MDFKIQYVNGVEHAVFADGSTKWIYDHDKYGKYFVVDNMLNNDEETPASIRKLFSHRIKDAVETIRNGDGDVIEAKRICGCNISVRVLYFLDREIGEELRQESIKGWEDTEFGWVVSLYYKTSHTNRVMLSRTYKPVLSRNEKIQPCVFDTREEAAAFAANMIEVAHNYAEKYSKKAFNISEKNKSKLIHATSRNIARKYGKSSMLINLFEDLLSDDGSIKDNLNAYTYGIEQYIKK